MGADIGNISDPSLIRGIMGKLTLQLIGGDQRRPTDPITWAFIPADGAQLRGLHESYHAVFTAGYTRFPVVMVNPWAAINPHALIIVVADML